VQKNLFYIETLCIFALYINNKTGEYPKKLENASNKYYTYYEFDKLET